MPKKKAPTRDAKAPKFNPHEFATLSLQVEECATTLESAASEAEIISHDHQQRMLNTVNLVRRDLERLHGRLTALYDGEVLS